MGRAISASFQVERLAAAASDDRPVIGQVLHRLSPAGAEVLAAALARELRGQYRFVFFCLDAIDSLGEQLAAEGFEVVCLDRRPGVDWGVARRLRRAVRERQIDILHAHQYAPFFYATLSRSMGGHPRVLFTEHGRHYPDTRSWKRVLANRLLLRRGDRMTAVASFIRDALVRNESLPARRIEVIYNGVEPERFALDDASRVAARAQVRAELDIPAGAPVVLQVARFHPVKDHATAVRAFARAVRRHPRAVLVLAGDGPQREATQTLAGELGIAKQVRFVGLRSDIAELMAGADVFMLSSLSEGMSVTLLEAMGARLPIVATQVGGNGEVVVDGQTGLLSPRQDAAALGDNLAALLANEGQRRRLGCAGYDRLLHHFTQAQMHRGFSRVYQALLLN